MPTLPCSRTRWFRRTFVASIPAGCFGLRRLRRVCVRTSGPRCASMALPGSARSAAHHRTRGRARRHGLDALGHSNARRTPPEASPSQRTPVAGWSRGRDFHEPMRSSRRPLRLRLSECSCPRSCRGSSSVRSPGTPCVFGLAGRSGCLGTGRNPCRVRPLAKYPLKRLRLRPTVRPSALYLHHAPRELPVPVNQPRVCGEHLLDSQRRFADAGTSPRVRGTLFSYPFEFPRLLSCAELYHIQLSVPEIDAATAAIRAGNSEIAAASQAIPFAPAVWRHGKPLSGGVPLLHSEPAAASHPL